MAEHMDEENRSHKHRERLQEVSNYPFQACCDPRERGDFGVTRTGLPDDNPED